MDTAGDARGRKSACNCCVHLGGSANVKIRHESAKEPQVGRAGDAQVHGAITGKSSEAPDAEVRIHTAQVCLAYLHLMISILELYRTLVLQLDIFVIQRNLREVSIHGNHIGLQKRAGHAKLSDDLAVTREPAQM